MTNPNDPAFARPGDEDHYAKDGLTKREYFAAMAMQGLVTASPYRDVKNYSDICQEAIGMADVLIAELNKEVKP